MDFKGCIKYGVLFWFSTIFAVLGIVLVLIGAIVQVTYHFEDPNIIESSFFFTPAIVIFIGVIIFVMAFLGCCGALKENHCMIKTFSILLLLLFILEVAVVIASYVNRDKLEDVLENRLNSTMHEYGNNSELTKTWNVIQHEFECCGLKEPSDWNNIGLSIPLTCCKDLPYNITTMEAGKCEIGDAYKVGCLSKLLEFFEKKALILGLSAVGISLIQIIMIGFSCALARSIRRDYTTV